MGKLALAAKVTHVPSMYLSEMNGPHKGCRQAAIDGLREIGRRARALGVETLVIFDTHWIVNSGYHVNCAPLWEGVYTSNELPHFIKNLPYSYRGDPRLGHAIAEAATQADVHTRAHDDSSLGLDYGALMPLRYMNEDKFFKIVTISANCLAHSLYDSAKLGAAARRAIERDYDGVVAILASGSLSHRFAQNPLADEYLNKVWSPFLEKVDEKVVDMWRHGEWRDFCRMLPEYASKCEGEGMMHDTAMALGALGWEDYRGKAEIVTPYFGSSGTGQINAILPV